MRWSSRVGDLTKHLFVVGPHAPDCSLQRLTANLSGSNPYTTPVDVNFGAPPLSVKVGQPLRRGPHQKNKASRLIFDKPGGFLFSLRLQVTSKIRAGSPLR